MIRSKTAKSTAIVVLLAFSIIFGMFITLTQISKAANIVQGNYKNVTVHTTVNITNAKPEVLAVAVYQDTNVSARNITLSAGLTRTVTCNASLRDWNGYSDITQVNSTFWYTPTSQTDAADNNNTHYTNATCANAGNGVNYTVNYICQSNVYYYANNGTWNCNVTAMDTYNKTGWNVNSTVLSTLYALNVTDGIDYGQVAVEDTSLEKTANVTNFGNMAINVSVQGYGVAFGDGLAMTCNLNGNISIANEKYSTTSVAYGSKTALTSSGPAVHIAGLTMPKQNVSNTPIINTTYWQLFIPANPAGNCTGFVIFQAEVP